MMTLAKATTFIILLATSVHVLGQTKTLTNSQASELRTFTVHQVGISLQLPHAWSDIDAKRLETINKLVREKALAHKYTFVAGIERDSSFLKRDGFPTYILIQKTPGNVSARQLLASFPTIRATTEKAANQAISDLGMEIALGDAYLDEKLKMVVVLVGGASDTGEKFVGRAYQVPTKQNLVGINVYCRPGAAKTVFAEVEKSLLTLQVNDAAKMPEDWLSELKSFLKR